MASNRAQFKKVNTANFSAGTLQAIGSRKPELAIVGAEIARNGGSKILIYK